MMITANLKKNTNLFTGFCCLFSALVFGLSAHAAGMFGGISYHDDVVCTYDVGTTHIVGRFTLALLGKITRLPFGGSNYSLPWFNGLVSLLFIGLSAWVIARALQIENHFLQILLAGILVVFPVVTGTFAYWFTVPYYMLALFLSCISAVLLARGSLKSVLTGILLAALMTGIYQAYLPVMLTLEILILLQKERTGEGSFRSWLGPLLGSVCGLSLYLVLMKLSLALTGKELYAYRGVDTLGAGNFGYPERIAMAYRMFFNQDSFLAYRGSDDYQLFMWSMKPVYCVLIALLLGMNVLLLFRSFFSPLPAAGTAAGSGTAAKRPVIFKRSGLLRTCILLLLFPLTVNFIFVMTDYDVYDLMLYGEVMIFVMLLWLVQQFLEIAPLRRRLLDFPGFLSNSCRSLSDSADAEALRRSRSVFHAGTVRRLLPEMLRAISCFLVLYSVLFYVRYDNLCYYKAGRMQEAAISYDNVLITRIQTLEGYDPSLPVCFLNEFEKDTSFLAADEELSRVRITPYDGTEIINDYSWVSFMKVHCGYSPRVIEDYGQYDSYVADTQMPRYPSEGSIQIIDGVIVVNF